MLIEEEKEKLFKQFGGKERTKAINDVLVVLRNRLALFSPDRFEAEHAATKFQISAAEVIEFARKMAELT